MELLVSDLLSAILFILSSVLQDVEDVRPWLTEKYKLHELLAAAVPPPLLH